MRAREAGSRSASTICEASSRVGTSTSAAQRGSSASMRSTIGMPNASVLPEPVGERDEHVAAGEGVGDDGGLDGEGGRHAAAREGARDGG